LETEPRSRDPVATAPSTPVKDVIKLMRDQALRRVPVLDNGKAVGIVSLGDLAIERDGESALADISAADPTTDLTDAGWAPVIIEGGPAPPT